MCIHHMLGPSSLIDFFPVRSNSSSEGLGGHRHEHISIHRDLFIRSSSMAVQSAVAATHLKEIIRSPS
jgi:hypothetical protein